MSNYPVDRLDSIVPSFLNMSYEERMAKVKEIRQGRVLPAKKKPVRKAAAKKKETNIANLMSKMSATEIAALKARIQKGE